MPKLRVTKHGGFKYGVGDARRQYGKGQEFLAKQKDARILVAAKLAEVVEEAPQQSQVGGKAAPKTRTAAKPRATAAKAGTRTYNRRDMKAK